MRPLIDLAKIIRSNLRLAELDIRILQKSTAFNSPEAFPGQHAEIRANIQLAMRHAEDARMRLGKVIQHAENRPSIYDQASASGRESAPLSPTEQYPAQNEAGFRGTDS